MKNILLKKNYTSLFLGFFSLFITTCSLAQTSFPLFQPKKTLTADDLFKLSLSFKNKTLVAQWDIADKHYLYKEKIKVSLQGNPLKKITYPKGLLVNDAYLGKTQVYRQFLHINLPIQPKENIIQVTIEFQGCSDDGLCHIPQKKQFKINMNQQKVIPSKTTQ